MKKKINKKPDLLTRMENSECLRKLTIEQVRNHEKFAEISEKDAKELIDTLYKLSKISYNIFTNGTGYLE
jgi:hypothetical protein